MKTKIRIYTDKEVDVPIPIFAKQGTASTYNVYAILNDQTFIELFASNGLLLIKNTNLESVRDSVIESWLNPENRITEDQFFFEYKNMLSRLSLLPELVSYRPDTESDEIENGAADADNLERWMHDKADAELREREQI